MAQLHPTAVSLIDTHLSHLRHPDGELLRLVQFAHSSPGLKRLRTRMAESLVHLLMSNGLLIYNGTDEALADLRARGVLAASEEEILSSDN